MKISVKTGLDLIRRSLPRRVSEKGLFGASSVDRLFGTATPSNIGATTEWLEEYSKNPRLAGVNKIATDNGTADFGIFKREKGDVVRVINHPLEKEIKDHTVPMFFSLWTAYRLMTGVSYIAFDMQDGSPKDLRIFSETHLVRKTDGDYTFQSGGKEYTYPRDRVIKDLDLDLNDPYNKGKGRMVSIAEEIELDTWIVTYLKNFYINSAQPALFIVPKGEESPDSEDLERLTTALRTEHKGLGNVGKTAVLSFDASIESVPSNHRDLELLETRKALRDAGIQHIGIPPEIMGIVENSNKATVVAAEHIYAKQVRMPILKHFEDIINSKILPRYKASEGLTFEFYDILPDDEEMGIKKAKEGREAQSITINEHRKYLGLAPLLNGAGDMLVGNTSAPQGEDTEMPTVEISPGEVDHEEVDFNEDVDKHNALMYSGGKIKNLDIEVEVTEES